jgi:PAS domain S-box-containing protein
MGNVALPVSPALAVGSSKTILIVDDHASVRAAVKSLLSTHSEWAICGEAANGEEAIALALKLKPSAIVMDVSMPGIDGLEATRRIRKKLPDAEVLIISQHGPDRIRQEAQKAGARGFVSKSNLNSDLVPAVEAALLQGASAKVQAKKNHHGRAYADAPRSHIDAQLLAAIVASSDDAIVSKNLDGIITSWNESAERIFGYTAEEAIGQPITLIIPPQRRGEEADIIARLRRGQRVDHFRTIRRHKDGTLLDVSLTISPIKDSSGKVVGASKVARDITAQIRAEERERQIIAERASATAKFRAVFEQTTVFAGIMTKEGILIDANKLCLDACGYSADEVLGRPYWETGWWRNFPESRDKIKTAAPLAAQGIPFRDILRYSCADGTERLLDFALYPIVDDKNNVLFLHPTGVDITDIKRTEESYRKLTETLEAEVRARTLELEQRNLHVLRQSELLREFSQRLLKAQDEERRHIARELHDSAGQTLTVLGINLAQLVQNAGRKAPEIAAQAEMIQELVQQLHREIRTTSYLLHPPLLDESGLASALSWYTQGINERSGLKIELDIADDFPRLPREMELVVFRLVQESLTNIHRHSGSQTAFIRMVVKNGVITVDVRDQGKGMSSEKLAEIRAGGSGVGIRGMRERLRQFEGSINIDSGASGTRVRVTIPLRKSTEPEDSELQPLLTTV